MALAAFRRAAYADSIALSPPSSVVAVVSERTRIRCAVSVRSRRSVVVVGAVKTVLSLDF